LTRVLVTGATGQDGTLLVRRLLADSHDVHGLTLSRPPSVDAWGPRAGRVTLHEGDLADAARVRQVVMDVAPEEIYNLAGQTSVAASWQEPVQTIAATGLGAAAVFDAALSLQDRTGTPVRVFQASSAEIFGAADETPQTEETPVRPASPYGAAKALAHHMARISRSRGLRVATGILYNHESPLRPTSFVTRKITSAAARLAVEGGEPLQLGNLDASRDWGWADDYVDAMVRACRHDVADDFVIATGQAHTVADFVRVAFARAGITRWRDHVEVNARFVRPTEASVQVGDSSKAARELGWTPSVPFEEVVGRMVDHDLALARAAATRTS
jgi:GDPmannose 4,6-dehydratase